MKLKRPDAIAEMMTKAVKYLPQATAAYLELVQADRDTRPLLLDKLHKIEEASDEQYVGLLRKVTSTFVTPYDREDLFAMIETLDDVIDELDHNGSLVVGFKIDKLPTELVANAKRIVQMSELCADAPALIKKPKKLESLLFDINKIENKIDKGYQKLLIEALVPGSDPIVAIQIKALADSLEEATARMEWFIHALGITAIKET